MHTAAGLVAAAAAAPAPVSAQSGRPCAAADWAPLPRGGECQLGAQHRRLRCCCHQRRCCCCWPWRGRRPLQLEPSAADQVDAPHPVRAAPAHLQRAWPGASAAQPSHPGPTPGPAAARALRTPATSTQRRPDTVAASLHALQCRLALDGPTRLGVSSCGAADPAAYSALTLSSMMAARASAPAGPVRSCCSRAPVMLPACRPAANPETVSSASACWESVPGLPLLALFC